ncbi:MAG: outer membrane lipoprotein LolB [Azoarcus sp.]|jgi:outer membrane lipoprotein LolB|nr:outer membrane lipoprotein LolB [Azoarcus sp.]
MPAVVRLFRVPLAALSACLLAACVTAPIDNTAPPAERHFADTFLLSGRLSASDGTQSASGRLEWQREAEVDRFTVSSPFGQIVARLDAGPAGAELTLMDGQHLYAERAADLLPRLFPGIANNTLPPERLAAWTQAAPPPDAEVRTRDAQGRPRRVIDQGWIVDYLDYSNDAPDAAPRRIDITRGDAHLRLLIDRWAAP